MENEREQLEYPKFSLSKYAPTCCGTRRVLKTKDPGGGFAELIDLAVNLCFFLLWMLSIVEQVHDSLHLLRSHLFCFQIRRHARAGE